MKDPLFKDKDTRIKKLDDFKKALRRVAYLSPKEEKEVVDRARNSIHSGSGMSKDAFLKKVVRPFQMDTKDDIDDEEIRNIKKLAK